MTDHCIVFVLKIKLQLSLHDAVGMVIILLTDYQDPPDFTVFYGENCFLVLRFSVLSSVSVQICVQTSGTSHRSVVSANVIIVL